MINHARTLLLNRTLADFEGAPTDALVPTQYLPISLPTELSGIRPAFIDANLHITAQDYIVSALMRYLHAPELESYTLSMDPRVTYRTDTDTIADVCSALATVTKQTYLLSDILPDFRADLIERPTGLAAAGWHRWTFNSVDATHTLVSYSRGGSATIEIAAAGGQAVSDDVPLVTDYLTAFFTLPTLYLTGTYTITFDTTIPVAYDFVADGIERLKHELARPGVMPALFKPIGDPYDADLLTFRQLWFESSEVALQLGGVLLAYIYQCDAIRRKAQV